MSNSCNPMDCSTPGLLVHHQLPEFTQTHVHWVGDAIQPPHPLVVLLLPSIFPNIRVFSSESALRIRWPSTRVSASTSVLPMNIQNWFPLGWTGLISLQSKDSQESSPKPQFKSINSLVLSLLYGPALMFIHDYQKDYSLDYMHLCWQSDVFAF